MIRGQFLQSIKLKFWRLLACVRPAPVAVFLKKLLRVKRRQVTTDIGDFYIDPVTPLGRSLLESGCYEREMENTVRKYLHIGSVFVDLGANEGYFTVMGSRCVGDTGKVIAIEPQQRMNAILRNNLEHNQLSNVEIDDRAVSDRESHAEMYLAPDTNPGSSGLVRSTRYHLPKQKIRTTTLEKLVSDYRVKTIDLLKVDIEGFEYEAIMGSKELFINRQVKAIALEIHTAQLAARGHDGDTITSFLAANGYVPDTSLRNLVLRLGAD